jgi:hypothetical protein
MQAPYKRKMTEREIYKRGASGGGGQEGERG